MANDIAFAENSTDILDAVYQRSSVSRCLNSGNRIIQASRHARFYPAICYPQLCGANSLIHSMLTHVCFPSWG